MEHAPLLLHIQGVPDHVAYSYVVMLLLGVTAFLVRRRLQMVYQDPFGSLNPRMKVSQIVGEPLEVHGMAGDRAAYDRVQPVLLAIGPKVSYIGASGLAVQLKLAINLVLMVEVIAFGEGVALAEKGGVSREVAVDAMLKSVVASPVLGYRGPFILDGKMPSYS